MSCCSIGHSSSTILASGIIRTHKLSPNNSLLYNALDGGFTGFAGSLQMSNGAVVDTWRPEICLGHVTPRQAAASSPVTTLDTFW
ncbi:hypothetical protein BDA96_01G183500 [Sorghum bicolor]|uniref:Uncharacterized protein n=1 Tax=Sorghum bicolor TaxID=4558 RepID=A0A921V0I7_SORBI|nr:hypothetical protein BDA96_01G183500 [Sorghum bicolor]